MPGAASAADGFDCYGDSTTSARTSHEIGEHESGGGCYSFSEAPIHLTIGGTPAHSSVTVKDQDTPNPSVVYTGASTGDDSYDIVATAGAESQTVHAFTTNVAATNDPPVCLGPQMSLDDLVVGKPYGIGQCTDEDGEDGNISISVVQQPTHGTLTVQNQGGKTPSLVYTPTSNGDDTFTFKGNDGTNDSELAGAVTHNVGAPAPVVQPAPVVPKVPAPAVAFGLKKVPSSIQLDSSGAATLSVTGTPGSKGSVVISSAKAVSTSKAKKKKKARKAVLTFARKSFRVPASGVARVKVKVTGKALKALKKAKKFAVKVTVKTDKTTVTKRIVIKAPKAKAKHKKRG